MPINKRIDFIALNSPDNPYDAIKNMDKFICFTPQNSADTVIMTIRKHTFCYEKVAGVTLPDGVYYLYESTNMFSEDVNRRVCEDHFGAHVRVYKQCVQTTPFVGELLK